MDKKKAWVWFKGGLKGGSWTSGFMASKKNDEGILIERADFISCRVPEWRVRFDEPINKEESPKIPKGAVWKY